MKFEGGMEIPEERPAATYHSLTPMNCNPTFVTSNFFFPNDGAKTKTNFGLYPNHRQKHQLIKVKLHLFALKF
jgi:hypothetical protein